MWKKVVVGGVLLFGMMMAFACIVLAFFAPGRQGYTQTVERRVVVDAPDVERVDRSDSQVRVRLIDDDGDGIPDRGVAVMPETASDDDFVVSVERQAGRLGGRFGGRFPAMMGYRTSHPILSFFGGILRLIGLVAVVIVAVAFFRRRKYRIHREE
ncbi:MAG: hypothetical protein JXA21_27035 [Anaerolineae bacterium]|nr:hypothetical protein [Anaerolineae bacterium]